MPNISRFHDVPAQMPSIRTPAQPATRANSRSTNGATKPSDAAFREAGVNCEMCHGPSLDHVERLKTPSSSASGRGSHRHQSAFHSSPAERYVGSLRAMSRAVGRARCATRWCASTSPPRVSRSGPYAYGAALELPAQGILSRRPAPCDHVRQRVVCTHGLLQKRKRHVRLMSRSTSRQMQPPNPTSLKFGVDADAMCVQCHKDLEERPERHTRHAAQTEASRLCLMPHAAHHGGAPVSG